MLFARLRKPDPNHEASKKALEHKKEIDKRLGHSLIQTNPYEGCMCVKVSVEKFGFLFCIFFCIFLGGLGGFCESWL